MGVPMHQLMDLLVLLAPDEDVAAVAAADNKLIPRAEEVTALNSNQVQVKVEQ